MDRVCLLMNLDFVQNNALHETVIDTIVCNGKEPQSAPSERRGVCGMIMFGHKGIIILFRVL